MAGAGPDPRPVIDWLIRQALLATSTDSLLPGCAERVAAMGIPVVRAHLSATTLHPQFEAVSLSWLRDAGVETVAHEHGTSDEAPWQRSPLRQIAIGETDEVRLSLAGSDVDVERYPILADFVALGGTDYIALGTAFGIDGKPPSSARTGVLSSWVTDRPGGFTGADIAALRSIQPAISAAARVALNLEIARTVMATYLGPDAGSRVLQGEIRRGDVQVIDAAILFADLRGFTALSDSANRAELASTLNAYLQAMAEPVAGHGGQVLKFLGDGMLASFALDGQAPAPVCARALAAARQALADTSALNAERAKAGEPVMSLDIALHLGDVLYGNVGSSSRLDFTVIGPAVNAASRIEALCGELDCPLLISGAFAAAAGPDAGLRPLGRHPLRGIRQPQELFTADLAG
ncbi:MAG: adenylate/guanylate cyclase domain-containing protein [Inquilinus sp.]|nr:adenylate/guanylate cyclase domain-containing protein [Inquilinus sp.]